MGDLTPGELHVPLDRRFRDLTDQERADPTTLAFMHELGSRGGSSWEELLKSERVVILAEAGSGKTREIQAEQRRLADAGNTAFFVPIEALQSQSLLEYLGAEIGDAEKFEEWKRDGSTELVLFLDAVDELKLTDGKLDNALVRVASAMGNARSRARIILSCRPTDWRPIQDLADFVKRFPVSAPRSAALSGDEEFLSTIRRESFHGKEADEPKVDKLRLVVLEPLDESQIKLFASSLGVTDVSAFIAEIRRHDAWSFARRPLDLKGLIKSWIAKKRLGTRLEQHEADAEISLRDDPERPDAGVLSLERATEGAERLALALYLTKTRTIHVPEQSLLEEQDGSSLDAVAVLKDWTSSEVKALLRRPMFDPATYGRVRFHHRSVAEFLAARRLSALRERGLSTRELHRLFFSNRYGEKVLVPSMRPIAAWLSIWEEDISAELLKREPEVLVLQGDPASLSLPVRAALLRAYTNSYGDGDWRGLDMPVTEIRRLAKADLADEIKAAWAKPHSNEEVRDFLLKIVWQGAIQECADLAKEAALNDKLQPYARTIAMRALAECQRHDLLREVADEMLAHSEKWPDRVVYSASDVLFPHAISAAEFGQLIKRTAEPKDSVSGFGWSLYHLVDDLEPGSDAAQSLRSTLSNLVWNGRQEGPLWSRPVSQFGHLLPALAKLVMREMQRTSVREKALIRDAAMAHRFNMESVFGTEESKQLAELLGSEVSIRRDTFQVESEIMGAVNNSSDAPNRFLHIVNYQSLLRGLIQQDWPWLLAELASAEPDYKKDLLEACVLVWNLRGKPESEIDVIRGVIAGDNALIDHLGTITRPTSPNPEIERMLQERQVNLETRKKAVLQEEQVWLDWKANLVADPVAAFEADRIEGSTNGLINFLHRRKSSGSTTALGAWRVVRTVFGDGVADEFQKALRRYWRETPASIWSTRALGDQTPSNGSEYKALTGLLMEASKEGWASSLTAEEAERATEWATAELNGHPEWLPELAGHHPDAVRRILMGEIQAEHGAITRLQHPRTLSAVQYGSEVIKSLVAPEMLDLLLRWPADPTEDPELANNLFNLDRVLTILKWAPEHAKAVAEFCEKRFVHNPRGPVAQTWIAGLFAFDLKAGVPVMRAALAALEDEDRRAAGALWLATLFGRRDYTTLPIAIDGDVELLLDLTRLSYECVRLEDDIQHDGVFTPGPRDRAEEARNHLISSLLRQPGQEAHDGLLALANEPLFQHMADRLRIHARERAAQDSEISAKSPAEYREWELRYGSPPKNRDELFDVMLDRLDDIIQDTLHHDFNDRATLAAITAESDMQPHIARKLAAVARGHYAVTREEEVADKKETDVRLHAKAFSGVAVIEIKIGDNSYSVKSLMGTIRDQLVGQYLRHQNCSVGCLLVTYAGGKGYRDPDSGEAISFERVIEILRNYAAVVEKEEGGRVRLEVVGLDLRNPLEPKVVKDPPSEGT